MKQRNIYMVFLSLLLMTVAQSAMAQDALFDKYEDTNGVTTIFISKTMLGMIPNVKAGNHDISKIAGKLDQLRILTCEKATLIPRILDDAKKTYKSEGYEAIMRMNDEGEKMTIYQRSLKGGKNEFVLLQEDGSNLNIINVKGAITLKDIQMITGN
ncbi:MAG: DUF4252 domain-containing protein [Prevotella sp.]|nr:DUF4252 domain-containing protein [Prevotella sp.]